jgi:lycopene cyclase domain-containing protein
MTYFGFLLIFISLPLAVLVWAQYRALTRSHLRVLGGMATLAVLYTTLWDNYLVANRIWWYEPTQVVGLTLGWVPLEEYLFFILVTFLFGLWLLFLWRRSPGQGVSGPALVRWVSAGILALAWVGMAAILAASWKPGRYLALELVWALPAIILQLVYGADLLWGKARLIAVIILTATLYLSAADWIAIQSGIWTISPKYTLGLEFGGVLPLEEVIFFLLTSTLVVFGIYLALAPASQERFFRAMRKRHSKNPALTA